MNIAKQRAKKEAKKHGCYLIRVTDHKWRVTYHASVNADRSLFIPNGTEGEVFVMKHYGK